MRAGDEQQIAAAPLPAAHVEFGFRGPFEGREVRWQLHLYTLAAYCRAHPADCPRPAQAFIDIQPLEGSAAGRAPGEFLIRVALDLPIIDAPALRKTLIMLRNYRRLRRGRHTFGGQLEATG